jgi:hypothetical protein
MDPPLVLVLALAKILEDDDNYERSGRPSNKAPAVIV